MHLKEVFNSLGTIDEETDRGADGATPENTLQAAECAAAIRLAVTRLPVELREALTLRYWQDHSYREIAEILSISAVLARQRVFQARNKLRRELNAWAPQNTPREGIK